jgi:hypothetical protein
MPYQAKIGREITRGTISRDRWRADVTVMCPDRIPVGGTAEMLVIVSWRKAQADEDLPDIPEDARPITLTFRKLSSTGGGDIRFDRRDGPIVKGFTANAERLYLIHGQAATVGDQSDVALDIHIEGELRTSIPLSVGPAATRVQVRASDGATVPRDLVPALERVRYKAITTPPTPGRFQWAVMGAAGLTIVGPADQETVTAMAGEATGVQRALCVLLTPEDGGPAVMAVHRVAVFAEAFTQDPANLTAPPPPQVLAAGWSRGLARTGEDVEMVAVVRGGMVGQRATFEIVSATGGPSVVLERTDVPLGASELLRVPWRVPDAIPGEGVGALGLSVVVSDERTASADAQEIEGQPGLQVHGRLQLATTLRFRLTDSAGRPMSGVNYVLRHLNGETVDGGSGRTGANGEITIPDLLSADYVLVVEGMTVLDASEAEQPTSVPASTPPATTNVVFSFLDVRLPDPAAGTEG